MLIQLNPPSTISTAVMDEIRFQVPFYFLLNSVFVHFKFTGILGGGFTFNAQIAIELFFFTSAHFHIHITCRTEGVWKLLGSVVLVS